MTYAFDRFLRYDEMSEWLHAMAAAHPSLLTIQQYGTSHEGRPLLLATITDADTGPHLQKPAHWIDANIHAIEVTGGVAALHVIHYLVTNFGTDPRVTEAVRTRTFYIAPRVNPDGVEWALADEPRFRRSSVRPWPWADGHRDPGLHEKDMNGDGQIRTMRIADPNGTWTPSTAHPRLMVRIPPDGVPAGTPRYRMLAEGDVVEHDGFTIPLAPNPERLDLNRNFPAGWGTNVPGSGDHPLSEPEIDALVRAIVARPNICGYNAFHTSGGVLLRPSSTAADSTLPPLDLWVWKELGARGEALTSYTVHSVFEDFTFDKSDTMSGAADDWAYEHLGVYGWTTEFWDVIHRVTGKRPGTHIWYTGPTPEEEVAVYEWALQHHPDAYADWVPFEHPQLGHVEIGGWDEVFFWANAPATRLLDEVRPHAEFAIFQALCSPRLEILHSKATALGGDLYRIEVGIANTGWLPTYVTQKALNAKLTMPIVAEVEGLPVVAGTGGAHARVELGQLGGRVQHHFTYGKNDGTPERAMVQWVVQAWAGREVTVRVSHERAGTATTTIKL